MGSCSSITNDAIGPIPGRLQITCRYPLFQSDCDPGHADSIEETVEPTWELDSGAMVDGSTGMSRLFSFWTSVACCVATGRHLQPTRSANSARQLHRAKGVAVRTRSATEAQQKQPKGRQW